MTCSLLPLWWWFECTLQLPAASSRGRKHVVNWTHRGARAGSACGGRPGLQSSVCTCEALSSSARIRGNKSSFYSCFPSARCDTLWTTGQRASVGPGYILSFSGRFLSEVTLKSWLSAKNGASELPLLPVLLAEDSGEWNHVKTNQSTFK